MDTTNNTAAERKKKLQEFLKQTGEHRQELLKGLQEKTKERNKDAAARSVWAQKQVKADEALLLKKKEELLVFKKREAERKEAVKKMLAEHKAEDDARIAKQAAEAELNAKKKAYMKSMHDQTTLGMLQEKKATIAKHAKLQGLNDADRIYNQQILVLNNTYKKDIHTILKNARQARNEKETYATQQLLNIKADIAEQTLQIHKKEQLVRNQLEAEHERKKMHIPPMLRALPKSPPMQTLEREWKATIRTHEVHFQKMKTDVITNGTSRAMSIKRDLYKQKSAISTDERERMQIAQIEHWQRKSAAEKEYFTRRSNAMQKEQEILHMPLEEVIAQEEELLRSEIIETPQGA